MSLSNYLQDKLGDWTPPKWTLRPEILLCGNIPKPLHGVAPRVVLGDKWWEKTRQEAYRSTDYHCIACGVPKHLAKGSPHLDAHEVYVIDYVAGRMTYLETVPVCPYCHQYIHSGRSLALLEQGILPHRTYAAIRWHGDRILRKAGLTPAAEYEGPFPPWKNWRLVINGVEYKPKYKSELAWSLAFRCRPKQSRKRKPKS